MMLHNNGKKLVKEVKYPFMHIKSITYANW